eukprot:CAMPEP_0179452304 /NCGR_PEP_ID=MMETSP0799-20121207/36196_1 /TAXON_ID=46947 /ORGANISM="Geminigera cryophila, Strain CCMP2564" /LENGTH=212 /DNA_ID=CAMNT_0021248105 /DNA_START=411 /DNA_END=1049 /DNA_ORIENTATION=+
MLELALANKLHNTTIPFPDGPPCLGGPPRTCYSPNFLMAEDRAIDVAVATLVQELVDLTAEAELSYCSEDDTAGRVTNTPRLRVAWSPDSSVRIFSNAAGVHETVQPTFSCSSLYSERRSRRRSGMRSDNEDVSPETKIFSPAAMLCSTLSALDVPDVSPPTIAVVWTQVMVGAMGGGGALGPVLGRKTSPCGIEAVHGVHRTRQQLKTLNG